jgi:hypothetical protein
MSSIHNSAHNGGGKEKASSASKSGKRTFADIIAEQPVTCVAVAAAAGFILGGGAKGTGGLTILGLLVQIAMREGAGETGSLGDVIGAALGDDNDA